MDKQAAIVDFDKSIELDPSYSPAFNNRGNAKKYLGDYAGAILDFDNAIKINPHYAIAYYNRGVVKQELGEESDACNDYKLAINYASPILLKWIKNEVYAWCIGL